MFVFLLALMILCCSNVAFKLEQSCSKFHYEEQTLEKLIRLQIFVEKIKEEVDSTQLKVVNELKALTIQREQFRTDIQEMKDDFERSKAVMEDDLLTKKMQHLEAITKYEDDITKFKESTMVTPVAFRSHIVADKTMANNKVIIFSSVLLNYNGSYDNNTGIFIVPQDGIYIFTAHICLSQRSHAHYGIYVNNAYVMGGLFGDADLYHCSSMSAVTGVTKGSQVTVRCKSSCGGDRLFDDANSSNSFSGVLIYRK